MEGDINTDQLRTLAPKWTLSGDDQLLNILQSTHQRIITKCQEVNAKLCEMSTALDDAGISLQNINNKFMALSNSQFIESRVYDDDDDVTAEATPAKDQPTPNVESELSMLKRSIEVLESMHEAVTILRDSDTESDSEDEEVARRVLKPKDIYAHRPLPHIIGSQAWKSKWHAGLLPEDSDTDSTTSKRENRESDQYSESDQEIEKNVQTDKLQVPDRTISETSSEYYMCSPEQDSIPQPAVKQTPSDIAAELARRLGGQPPKVIETESDFSPSKPTVRKVYRPEQPVTGTVFSDEPPPIDDYESESSSDNGDIFSELHKQKPYEKTKNVVSDSAADLFGFNREDEEYDGGDIFREFAKDKPATIQYNTNAKQKPPLFNDDSQKDELFVEKREDKQQVVEKKEETESGSSSGVKKPIGGISLFGNNKGAESIGAAILKRNRKSSSSSSEATDSQNIDERDSVSKNDIFDNLFDRSKNEAKILREDKTMNVDRKIHKGVIDEIFEINKPKGVNEKVQPKKANVIEDIFDKSSKNKASTSKKNETEKEEVKKPEIAKVDLFSDNLFDDIDDIFTSNVVKIPKNDDKNQKTLFDDDDDLFSGIAAASSESVSKNNNKLDLESGDDLFSEKLNATKQSERPENVTKPDSIANKETKVTNATVSNERNKAVGKSIFDSDDDLFIDGANLPRSDKSAGNETKTVLIPKPIKDNEIIKVDSKKVVNMKKSIFDSDSDSDIFANIKVEKKFDNVPKNVRVSDLKADDKETNKIYKKNDVLDADDELFRTKQKPVRNNNQLINQNANKKEKFSDPTSHLFSDDDEDPFMSKEKSKTKKDSRTFDNEKTTEQKSMTESDTSEREISTNVTSENKTFQKHGENTIQKDNTPDVEENKFKRKPEISPKVYKLDKVIKDGLITKPEIAKYKDFTNIEQHLNLENNDNINVPKETVMNQNLNLHEDNNTFETETTNLNTKLVTNDREISMSKTDIFENNLISDKERINKSSPSTINVANEGKSVNEASNLNDKSQTVDSLFKETNLEVSKITDEVRDDDKNYVLFKQDTNLSGTKKEGSKFIEEDDLNIFQNAQKPLTQNTKAEVFIDIFSEPPNYQKPTDSSIFKGEHSLTITGNPPEPDIFSDILSEPPIFEKPKEPKKSKNVNALFDDDSDDEALFFKKSDVVEETLHDFSSNEVNVVKDNIFGIFHDEPPAIDVNFITKSHHMDKYTVDTESNLEVNKESVHDINQSAASLDNNEPKTEENIIPNKNETSNEFNEKAVVELPKSPTPRNTKSELNLRTKADNFKNTDIPTKKPIKIHDLFSQDDDDGLFKSISSTSVSKIDDEHKNNNLAQDKSDISDTVVSSSFKTSNLQNKDKDDDIFKNTANVEEKKNTTIQEDEIDNLFISKNKIQNVETGKNFEDIFKSAVITKPILIKETKITNILTTDSNIDASKNFKNISQETNNLDELKSNSDIESASPKKIGKLKTKINIDVAALLPGASPKRKPKLPDNETPELNLIKSAPIAIINDLNSKSLKIAMKTDDNSKSTEPKTLKSDGNKDNSTSTIINNIDVETVEQKTNKNINFDEQEPAVLDNTASKERPKIQVKRRPSTRRARREAVRKSTVDIDSTDNSSSLDDQPKSLDIEPSIIDKQDLKVAKSSDMLTSTRTNKLLDKETSLETDIKGVMESDKQNIMQIQIDESDNIIHKNIVGNKEAKLNTEKQKVSQTDKVTNEQAKQSQKQTNNISNKNVTSKIVYVLNDEDIFNTNPKGQQTGPNLGATENLAPVITTLGNVYKDDGGKDSGTSKKTTESNAISNQKNYEQKTITSLFDDLTDDDEELFGKMKKKKPIPKKSLFDSDTDEELFSAKEKTKELKRSVPVAKGSLFGDDGDDDLFGDRSKDSDKTQPSRPSISREATKSTEPVFQDPLSMLRNED